MRHFNDLTLLFLPLSLPLSFSPSLSLQTISEEPVSKEVEEDTAEPAAAGELYVACYPYESAELGDLTFSAGEYVMVVKKDGDWWTGVIGERTGIFPSNYVQEASATETVTPQDSAPYYSAEPPATAPSYSTQSYADDVQNQEEADTEVSEIITQSKSDIQDTYTRPMSTSSQTSVIDQQSIYFLK